MGNGKTRKAYRDVSDKEYKLNSSFERLCEEDRRQDKDGIKKYTISLEQILLKIENRNIKSN